MKLYRVTKQRQSRQYQTNEWYTDKSEVVITERRGRVSQCLAAAKAENRSVEYSTTRYRCFVEVVDIKDAEFEFLSEVEFPEWA